MDHDLLYRGGYKYQVAATRRYQVWELKPECDVRTPFLSFSRTGELVIRAGYAWDGPSGPAIDTRNFMRGSLIHDALYQMIRDGHLPRTARKAADDVLRRVCIEDGMWKLRANWVYFAVRTFAQRAAMPSSGRPLKRAP